MCDYIHWYFVHLFSSGLSDLPKDCRALLNTPRSVEITSVGDGHFWYNGIEKNLRTVFSNLNKNMSIALMFNVDGLPLFNSSQRSFWPILASVHSKYRLILHYSFFFWMLTDFWFHH